MKKTVLFCLLAAFFLATTSRSQDAAMEERIDRMSGQIADLMEARKVQQERLSELTKEIAALREQLSQSTGGVASREEIKRLAEKIQELDQKRIADNERILREIEKLGRMNATAKGERGPGKGTRETASRPDAGLAGEKAFEHIIQSGDTFSTIAQAYREKGFKVTAEQIQKANPDVKPTSLQVGQKIYIPLPKQ